MEVTFGLLAWVHLSKILPMNESHITPQHEMKKAADRAAFFC
jgi:hypothetical protein